MLFRHYEWCCISTKENLHQYRGIVIPLLQKMDIFREVVHAQVIHRVIFMTFFLLGICKFVWLWLKSQSCSQQNWWVCQVVEMWRRRRWCMLSSDCPWLLCCWWGALPPMAHGWWGRGLAAAAGGVRGLGAGGQGGRGGRKQWHYNSCLLGGSYVPHGEDWLLLQWCPAPPPAAVAGVPTDGLFSWERVQVLVSIN